MATGGGCSKDSGTRSSLLWEIERILKECKNKPQILLMENVPNLLSNSNNQVFTQWQETLEKLGYSNFYKVIQATEYGIPQTRNRVFMVSVLGNYVYYFPRKLGIKIGLYDILQEKVDRKYFLSRKMINVFTNDNLESGFPRLAQFRLVLKKQNINDISVTLTTKSGDRPHGCYILIPRDNTEINLEKILSESNLREVLDNSDLETNKELIGKRKIMISQKGTTDYKLQIRKITPLESFRLMGVKQDDYDKVRQNQKDNGLYHLMGDSIVTTVLMAIFGQLLDIDYEPKIEEVISDIID